MILASTTRWRSAEVELFPLTPEDVTERYVGWLNDPQINRYLESRFERHTLDSTRTFVADCAASSKSVLFGIRCKHMDGAHVGNIKIETNARHGLGEVGILLGEKRVHGRGVATEAIRLAAGVAREELHLRKLTAGCYAGNKGSERAFVKAGFAVEGVRPDHFLLDGRPENLILLGLFL